MDDKPKADYSAAAHECQLALKKLIEDNGVSRHPDVARHLRKAIEILKGESK